MGGSVADAVRLLARVAGYTSDPRRAVVREPEAVDRDTQDRITGAAHRVDTVHGMMRAGERRQLSHHERLNRARAQARISGVDIRPQIYAAKMKIDAGRSHAHIDRYIATAIERRVFPDRSS